MKELKINKGIELMLRRTPKKEYKDQKPPKGFTITKNFNLLKTRVYFNLDLRWGKEEK